MQNRQAIVITGPVGSGKTTVMAAITEIMQEQNQSCAGIDMDHLRWFFPKQPGDPFGGDVGRKNLAFLAADYRSIGIPVLAIADHFAHGFRIRRHDIAPSRHRLGQRP